MKTTELLSSLRNNENLSFKNQLLLIVKLSVPSILGQLSSIIMSYIDASMVGHIGTDEAAAIGLVASSTWLYMGFCYAAALGFTVQAAHLIGAKKEKDARNLLKISFVSTIAFSVFMMIIGLLLTPILPSWLGCDEEILKDAGMYFFVFCLSVPIIQLNDLSSEMLISAGEMKIPSILQVFMAVLNISLNYLFIFVMKMGVFGAAFSTLISRLIVTILLLFFLLKKSPILSFRKGEKFVFDFEYIKKAFKIALPIVFEQIIMSGGYIAYTKIVAPLGKIALASNSLAITAESLCYMPAHGLGSAASTLCGQSFGAKRKDLTYRFGWLTTILGMILMFFVSVLMFIFSPQMIGFLSPDLQIRKLGAKILRIEAFCEPFYGASIVSNGALRGTGDTFVPSLFKFFSMWGIRIPLAYFLSTRYGLEGVWAAMSFELCIRGILHLIRLKGKKWIKGK